MDFLTTHRQSTIRDRQETEVKRECKYFGALLESSQAGQAFRLRQRHSGYALLFHILFESLPLRWIWGGGEEEQGVDTGPLVLVCPTSMPDPPLAGCCNSPPSFFNWSAYTESCHLIFKYQWTRPTDSMEFCDLTGTPASFLFSSFFSHWLLSLLQSVDLGLVPFYDAC